VKPRLSVPIVKLQRRPFGEPDDAGDLQWITIRGRFDSF
jgi:hypothetical protein